MLGSSPVLIMLLTGGMELVPDYKNSVCFDRLYWDSARKGTFQCARSLVLAFAFNIFALKKPQKNGQHLSRIKLIDE